LRKKKPTKNPVVVVTFSQVSKNASSMGDQRINNSNIQSAEKKDESK
jgi:hypothetical protein